MDPPIGNGFWQKSCKASIKSKTTQQHKSSTKKRTTEKMPSNGAHRPLPIENLINMSVFVCLVAIIALNSFGFIATTNAANHREYTHELPLQKDGSRFGESSSSRILPDSSVPCPTGMFRCNDGKCITSLFVCNYQKDCDGGEDEQQSCPPPECEAGQISCGQYIFNKTYCIPPHFRCDMTDDCEDKSDEAQCSEKHRKSPYEN